MYNIRGVKKNGITHNREAEMYTIDPRGEIPSLVVDNDVVMYVSDHEAHYEAIFVMNSHGNTIDTLRAKRKGM